MNSDKIPILKGYAFKNSKHNIILIHPFKNPFTGISFGKAGAIIFENSIFAENSKFGETIIPKEYLKHLL